MEKKTYIIVSLLTFTFLVFLSLCFFVLIPHKVPEETQIQNVGKSSHPKALISKDQRLTQNQKFVKWKQPWGDITYPEWDEMIGDKICHDVFNLAMYDYDAGDCCLIPMPIDSISFCQRCICHKRTQDCPFPYLIGDGNCQEDALFNENCLFDGGDCDPEPDDAWSPTPDSCGFPMRDTLGDGVCDDKANEPWCYYDLGDCCKKDSIFDFCQECRCQVDFESDGVCVEPSLVGNGNCDPFLNYKGCLFDGGDCL